MKTDALKTYLTRTLRRVLRPIVRIALRGELTHREFAEITKLAFFDVARADYGIAGRQTNLARVAILTGLSRKECTRLKATADIERPVTETMSPATRVITAWHESADYCAADGTPLALPREGEGASLARLFAEHAGDIPTGAMFTELKRIGAIEQTDDQRWRLVKRSFIPAGFDRDKIRILGNQLSDLGATIVHNTQPENVAATRMQRYVVMDAIDPQSASEFQRLATERGQALLEHLDAWLTSQQSDPDTAQSVGPTQRVGLGIYFFQENTPSGESS